MTLIAVHAEPPVANIGSRINTAVDEANRVSDNMTFSFSIPGEHTLSFNAQRKLRVQKRGKTCRLVTLDQYLAKAKRAPERRNG